MDLQMQISISMNFAIFWFDWALIQEFAVATIYFSSRGLLNVSTCKRMGQKQNLTKSGKFVVLFLSMV